MNRRVLRKAGLAAAAAFAVAVLGWLGATQGPLAPVRVTVARVEQGSLVARTFGIGTVEARRSYALGPTNASRVKRVLVDQGEAVRKGQLVAELDPVDLDERVASAEQAALRAASAIRAAQAGLAEASGRARIAEASAKRYAELRARGFVSAEAADAKMQEGEAAKAAAEGAAAALAAARRDRDRALADRAGASKLRAQAQLVSPVDGVVTARLAEPGTAVVAGQPVLQVIDPASVWVRTRIDQRQAAGLRAGQPAEIVLRAEPGRMHRGRVARVDWVGDPVTEERVVDVDFAALPAGIALGDLAEVIIRVEELRDARSVPAVAVKRIERQDGVWQVKDGVVEFRPVQAGTTTLEGRRRILEGPGVGEEVVAHSERALRAGAKVRVVPSLVRMSP